MEIERQYHLALDLTRQMLSVATSQDWDKLAELEKQRASIIAAIAPISPAIHSIDSALAHRIAGIIREIERESGNIAEQVQAWQEHARILLRINQPSS